MVAIYLHIGNRLIAGMKCDLLSLVECDHYEDGLSVTKKSKPGPFCWFYAQLEDDMRS